MNANTLKRSRKKTNNKWFETQDSIDYWEDFDRQKIVYNDIAQKLSFSLAGKGVFFNNTVYSISGNEHKLKYLIGFLNSSLIDWYYKTLSVQLGEKAVRLFSIYVEKIPIVKYTHENKVNLLIDSILSDKYKSKEKEAELDKLIFDLYDLSIEEINFIEAL